LHAAPSTGPEATQQLGCEVTVVKDAVDDYSDAMIHDELEINVPNYANAIVDSGKIIASILSLEPITVGA
jgi:hypothetical protein